jgi:hypothetical protein
MKTRDNELAATHKDGSKLYAPLWDGNGEIIPSALPLAAVSINQDGKTFPEGSFWLRNERGNLKAGWTWAKGYRNSAMTVKSALKPTPIRGPKDRNASVAVFSRDLALGHDGQSNGAA